MEIVRIYIDSADSDRRLAQAGLDLLIKRSALVQPPQLPQPEIGKHNDGDQDQQMSIPIFLEIVAQCQFGLRP